MKQSEIKAMPAAELHKKLAELRTDLMKHNGQIASGSSIKKPSLVRSTKRLIARLIQELSVKEVTVKNNG